MPRISADYNRMLSAAGEFNSQSNRIDQIRSDIQSVMNKIPLETTYYSAAKTRMMLQCRKIESISNKYRNISSVLEEIQNTYKSSDQRTIDGRGGATNTTVEDIWGRIIDSIDWMNDRWTDIMYDAITALTNSDIYKFFAITGIPYTPSGAEAMRNFLFPHYSVEVEGMVLPLGLAFSGAAALFGTVDEGKKSFNKEKGKIKSPFADTNKKWKDGFKESGDYKEALFNSDSKKQGLGDSDEDKQKKLANKFMEREVDLEISGRSKEISLASAKGKLEGDYGSVEGGVKALKAGANAGWGVGEYTTKDAEGKIHHGVGLYGEVGASASALEADAKARLGNKYIGVYGKAEGKVGSATATAGVNAGFIDGKPQAYVGGKAEAVLVEGSVSGGATVLGTDVGAKVTGKVGVGANANIGLKDGHLVIDAGASLGVGAEVALDIDMNNTIDTVKEVGSAAIDLGKDIGKGAADLGKNIGKGAANLGKNIGNGICDAAEGFADFIGWH